MSNIEVKKAGDWLDLTINDPALIRRYEKCCALDAKKITERIDAFLSRQG